MAKQDAGALADIAPIADGAADSARQNDDSGLVPDAAQSVDAVNMPDSAAQSVDAGLVPDAAQSVDADLNVDAFIDAGENPYDAWQCQAESCSDLSAQCGIVEDGCGQALNCGGCGDDAVCQDNNCVNLPLLDCSGISANGNYEVCEQSASICAGVYSNGAGCNAYCAAAGLHCVARFGGDLGCSKEANYPIPCDEVNNHLSDWCECAVGEPIIDPDPSCAVDPGNPPVQQEIGFLSASYVNRSSWVLQCRDYAYTALYSEHEACDGQYSSGSGRGSAHFSFYLPRGTYQVFLVGRHTVNRNPHGALVRVRFDGGEQTALVNQRDDGGIVADLVGTYCLGGSVEIVVDSTVSSDSDSVERIRVKPVY